MKNLGLSFYTKQQRKYQNQTGIFVVEEHNGTHVHTVQCWRESQIEDSRLKPEVEIKQRNISDSIQDINDISKVPPTFSRSTNTPGLAKILSNIGHLVNQIWPPLPRCT